MSPTQSSKRNGVREVSCGHGSQGDRTVRPHLAVYHSRRTFFSGPLWWDTTSKEEELVVIAAAAIIKITNCDYTMVRTSPRVTFTIAMATLPLCPKELLTMNPGR